MSIARAIQTIILFFRLNPNYILNMAFDTIELLTIKQTLDDSYNSQKNKQYKVMIVLPSNENKELLSDLLPKIMKAVHVDIDQEALVINVEQPGINIIKILTSQKIEKVISFGLNPTSLSLNISAALYKINKIGTVQFLFSDDLNVISTSQERKKALWNRLKALFPS